MSLVTGCAQSTWIHHTCCHRSKSNQRNNPPTWTDHTKNNRQVFICKRIQLREKELRTVAMILKEDCFQLDAYSYISSIAHGVESVSCLTQPLLLFWADLPIVTLLFRRAAACCGRGPHGYDGPPLLFPRNQAVLPAPRVFPSHLHIKVHRWLCGYNKKK